MTKGGQITAFYADGECNIPSKVNLELRIFITELCVPKVKNEGWV